MIIYFFFVLWFIAEFFNFFVVQFNWFVLMCCH